MTISTKTRQMLWGRAAARCAFPDCRKSLIEDPTEASDAALIGELCHMVADKPGGPRGTSPLTAEERDEYQNLILLCRNHHRVIDQQEETYTIPVLQDLKAQHLRWVEENLPGHDKAKQRDDEYYASIVDEWSQRSQLDRWEAWSSWLLSADQPVLSNEMDETLRELRKWLFARIWPGRYRSLESAFTNFIKVTGDLLDLFHAHSQPFGEHQRITEKFYKIKEWDEQRYAELGRLYDYHVALVEDLALELTRAANYVCDQVRASIQPSYRLNEGHVVTQYGPTMRGGIVRVIPRYSHEEIANGMYTGLEDFKKARRGRDFCFARADE